MSFVTPYAPTVTRASTSYSVGWVELDAGSGISSRSLQRQKVASSDATCTGTFTNDGSTDTGASPRSQTLASGNCYRWTQTLTDRAGRSTSCTSGTCSSSSYLSLCHVHDPGRRHARRSDHNIGQRDLERDDRWRNDHVAVAPAPEGIGHAVHRVLGDHLDDDAPSSPDTNPSPRNNTGLTDGMYRLGPDADQLRRQDGQVGHRLGARRHGGADGDDHRSCDQSAAHRQRRRSPGRRPTRAPLRTTSSNMAPARHRARGRRSAPTRRPSRRAPSRPGHRDRCRASTPSA